MLSAEPFQFAGAADALDGCVNPQRHQQSRIGGVASRHAFDRLDRRQPAAEVQSAHERPNHPCGMVWFEQFIERVPVQFDLITLRHAQPWVSRHRLRGGNLTRRGVDGVTFIEECLIHADFLVKTHPNHTTMPTAPAY